MGEVADSWTDVWGRTHTIGPATRAALEKALGPKRPARAAAVPAGDGRCHQPDALRNGRRVWGLAVQLYGIRSARNWGIGDFGDLRGLVELAASLGASLVGVSPLHAGGPSPYSPSSRHALNTLYLDVEALPEYARSAAARRLVASRAFQRELARLRAAPFVEHAGVAACKQRVLQLLFDTVVDRASVRRFGRACARGVRDYAVFEALRERLGDGWQGWPEAYRDPRSRGVAAFARRWKDRVDFHLWVQSRARDQLDGVQRHAAALGMPIGLYVDLALGADAGGAEVWSDQTAFADGATCGAPPDEFNPKGQDWGLPPYSPRALRAAAHRPFVDLLRAVMPAGGALRMDHVMALARLWWIPQGRRPDQGGYVRYPFEELLAVLARESRARRCLVVGEDLGTVPKELRSALNAAGVLSYRPLLFERSADGGYARPWDYPRDALTCVSTHDLPTWIGFFARSDLALRRELGLAADAAKEADLRTQDARRLAEALRREDLDASAASAHRFLARTPSAIMMVQPEDVFEVAEQANLPGTTDEHPNWRRKLPLPLESWRDDRRLTALADALAPFRGTGKRTPRATYRLQLNRHFRFADATALVPYLAALGVSHVYASPFLKARPGSMHGYDITDHARLNPEIGTEADLDALLAALRQHALGLVLDVVPNHMGVLLGDNPWWTDVLARGQASPHARFFDIDWSPAPRALRGKVLLPVLGHHYGEALERRELKVVGKEVRYFEHRFPLSRASLRSLDAGKANRDPLAMHRLLEQQHYRLAFWRVASDEINYRRFFEIADLAAVRVEDPAVFAATHARIAELCQRPEVDGLRIDHPDGLADPKTYFDRLRAFGGPRGSPWLVVEKIVAGFETLPADWAVDGTTGYRFANLLTGLFVRQDAAERFDRMHRRFTGEHRSFDEIEHESRMLIMSTTLAAELNRLASRLQRIAAASLRTRDYTLSGLRRALAEVAAYFPVYRTYVTARGASDADRRYVNWAVGRAKRASRIADASVFDFLRDVLLLEVEAETPRRRNELLEFVTRFQQFSAPVVAKGVEDTAFYRHHRLIALNEVGNDPRVFGFSLKAFHAASDDRAQHWPRTMIGTSTHDTKRSEDVRARIAALSELGSSWGTLVRRWSLMNRSHRTALAGTPAPAPADEYLLYQTVLGIWPAASPSSGELRSLERRLRTFMLKAAKEAKVHTSWINPDAAYEEALERFITRALANPLFVKDLEAFVPRLARIGMLVGLAQAVIKVASPGVPDYYQGSEIWDWSLVDPDNRRRVDYRLRRRLLRERPSPEDMLADLGDGRAKLHVIRAGLRLRRELPELFYEPAYAPLYASDGMAEHVCAFALRHGSRHVVAVAPRLFAAMVPDARAAPIGDAWGAATLPLPAARYVDVLTGDAHDVGDADAAVAALLGRFPVALLASR